MLNRDEKNQEQEEGEYHFSDEEVSYEVETEAPKAALKSEAKESLMSRLTQSKRMIISGVVFLVLVFIVYRMILPGGGTSAPPTDITPQAPAAPVVQKAMTLAQPPVQTTRAAPAVQQPVPPVQTAQQAMPAVQPIAQQQAPIAQVPAAQPPVTAAPIPFQAAPMAVSSTPTPSPVPTSVPAPSTIAQQPPATLPVAAMPAVIPVQAPAPTPNQMAAAVASIEVPGSAGIETKITSLAIENEKFINQLQSDYSQKLNEFATQNKFLQEQLRALNTRVANIENQLSQLLQAIAKQTGPAAGIPSSSRSGAAEPKIAYNVQAIIPGRAWLRSDNGETVTVAEGDVLKDAGRITKIDPYDGVVEIDTGRKMVTLSYGSGG